MLVDADAGFSVFPTLFFRELFMEKFTHAAQKRGSPDAAKEKRRVVQARIQL